MTIENSILRQKAVFLDRDGVLNEERGQHTFRLQDFIIRPNVPEALRLLKTSGYYLAVVTNQSGIAQGMYTRAQMEACHEMLHQATGYVIDTVFYSPYHPSITESLSRKPGHLMLERAMARFQANPAKSWMLGDKNRDLVPAHRLHINTIIIGEGSTEVPILFRTDDLLEAAEFIVANG